MSEFVKELFSLEGKVALVTGASRGIGYNIALGYAKAGAKVVISSRNLNEIKKSAAEISKDTGAQVLGLQADSKDANDIDQLFDDAEGKLGPVDILMINAGIINRHRTNVWEIEEAEWDQIIDINLKGTFLTVRRGLQSMVPRKRGRLFVWVL